MVRLTILNATMSVMELIKKQFTASKLIFHFLFWGLHIGLFAFGWYVVTRGLFVNKHITQQTDSRKGGNKIMTLV